MKSAMVAQYEENFSKQISKKLPISELSFLVVDTETTGLDVKKDHILAFGGIKVSNNRILVQSSREQFVHSKKKNASSIKIHEIVQPSNAISPREFVRGFLPYLGSDILVAHHAGFDLAMIEKICYPFGLRKLANPVVDTGDLAMRLEHGIHYDPSRINLRDYSLDKLCERYNIPIQDRHTAAGDAFLTAQLLLKLLKEAEKRGVVTYGDLMRW
ncbi:3'-5' exonuclease [Echinicola vietnamensis]|uniref:DNA polymerase III, alpha subunit (Gram-positive type) n=1 Tax=Echinicola vietnamensis (strain DSM 17526 / LMG 23754 / KMM 6221) TaxID=926556 RepID=L0FXT2_ECHVK|nr:3'-5' exonuclease [Echinicola vietnamensis]AGA77541.1 DNA polymerase III, alpha subunit (gram-positive type) [Echinicola vietnamensis DSM 17526]